MQSLIFPPEIIIWIRRHCAIACAIHGSSRAYGRNFGHLHDPQPGGSRLKQLLLLLLHTPLVPLHGALFGTIRTGFYNRTTYVTSAAHTTAKLRERASAPCFHIMCLARLLGRSMNMGPLGPERRGNISGYSFTCGSLRVSCKWTKTRLRLYR